MVYVLVQILEGQQVGLVSQEERLVHSLLHLVVDACQMVEEVGEAQKAHIAEEVVHIV